MDSGQIVVIFVVLGVAILIFFLLREINCWYFKINERTRLQQEQLQVSKHILTALVNTREAIEKSKESGEKLLTTESENAPHA